MSTTRKSTDRFSVGDWVSFPYGARALVAQVIEERGPLGVKRRRLYRVRVGGEGGEADSFEMPEDELNIVSPPEKPRVLNYMKEGGLVAILRSNLSGGDIPRVWLTYTPRGDITHSFAADRGILGGAVVPFFALHEGKVFTGKQDEVIAFLAGFGLDRDEANEVLAAIGTAP
jgi:hypothetical protein